MNLYLSIAALLFTSSIYAQKVEPNLLFLQQGKAGEIKNSADKKGCYTISIQDSNDPIVYITDEPYRKTGNLSAARFIESWNHNEQTSKDHPNAILHMRQNDWTNDSVVLTQLTYDYKNKVFHYTACPLAKNAVFKTGKMKDISLFIDPFHEWPP